MSQVQVGPVSGRMPSAQAKELGERPPASRIARAAPLLEEWVAKRLAPRHSLRYGNPHELRRHFLARQAGTQGLAR